MKTVERNMDPVVSGDGLHSPPAHTGLQPALAVARHIEEVHDVPG